MIACRRTKEWSVPIPITDEQHALGDSIRAWAASRHSVAVVRALEAEGKAPRVLPGLAEIGLFAVSIPEKLGGAGGSVADAAAGLEAAATSLLPGPVLGTMLGGLLLARVPDSTMSGKLLPSIAEGSVRIAVALGAGGLRASRSPGGGLVVDGVVGPVLDADSSAHLLLTSDGTWFLLPPGTAGVRVRAATPFDFSRSAGQIELTHVTVPPEALLPELDSATVTASAATLGAAEAAGVAAWSVLAASEYAKVREQFGRPIGSFQAVKHLCAEMLCRAEVAAALAWDAARDGRRRARSACAGGFGGGRRRAGRGRRQREGLHPGPRRDRVHLGARLGARRTPLPAAGAVTAAVAWVDRPAGGGMRPSWRCRGSGARSSWTSVSTNRP
jgi:alkylation response protein AidB-like acyl-CoA dehydrogenase